MKTIEDKIKELELKKMLVVDDRDENLAAARKYFKDNHQGKFDVEYATNGADAKRLIKEAFDAGEIYQIVLTDMQMEKIDAGKDVAAEALRYLAFPVVITAGNHNGAYVDVKPDICRMNGYKTETRIWQEAFEKTLEIIGEYGKLYPINQALKNMRTINCPVGEPELITKKWF